MTAASPNTAPDAYEAFSDAWAQAWCRALNESPAYRSAAAQWEGSVGLVMTGATGSEGRAVFLDLWHGECRGARAVEAAELAAATYVMEASEPVWRELLAVRTSPLMLLMTGKLRLTRGNLGALLPYAGAAKELVDTVTLVRTYFPGDPGA